jgi:hypothetical protein
MTMCRKKRGAWQISRCELAEKSSWVLPKSHSQRPVAGAKIGDWGAEFERPDREGGPMMEKSVLAAAAVVFSFAIGMATAQARGGGPGGAGAPGFQGGAAPTWQGSDPPGFSEGGKTNFEPLGWDKGKKEGWKKDNNTQDPVPPGLQRR